MLVGYIRVSSETDRQNSDLQEEQHKVGGEYRTRMIPKDTTRPIRVFAQTKHWSFWQSHRFGDWRSLLIPKAIPWLTPGFVLLSVTHACRKDTDPS